MTRPLPRFKPELHDQERHPPRCPACGHDTPETEHPSVEPGFSVLRCPDCGLGRTWPPESPEKIASWYPPQYYGKGNVRFNPFFEMLVRWFRRRRSAVLHNRVPHGPVLDVGCGRGLMLNYLRQLGYEPHGVEYSETAAWHARNVLKLPVTTEDFVRAPHERDRYNAVIFWHSLEHFSNPVAAVARAYESLKPGGLLVIAVPNYDSWQARAFGRFWFHLDVPRHYFHFGARSLEAVLARHRFRIVQLDHFSFEQNPYGILQSLYNALGLRFNLLYSLLKDRSARVARAGQHPVQTLVIAALLPVFLPAALFLTVVEAALRSGGTIELYAFKE
ncbi:MAG: class I SAM-dependent methyltransferase [Elusimicrobia bacterium]|nr:class I SAM-dependent methyltransferase [Elusimicrobiota bacterium]